MASGEERIGKFSKIVMDLVLYKDDEVLDDYEMIDAQQEWIVID